MGPKRFFSIAVGVALLVGALQFTSADAGCVTINGDRLCDGGSGFPGGGGGGAAPAIAKPKISIKDAAVLEGLVGSIPFGSEETPQTVMKFKVVLNHAYTQTVKVDYATSPGTATEGGPTLPTTLLLSPHDYVGETGTVTFRPGQTSKKIKIAIVPEFLFELDETFFVTLSNARRGKIKDGQATGTILNDDSEVLVP